MDNMALFDSGLIIALVLLALLFSLRYFKSMFVSLYNTYFAKKNNAQADTVEKDTEKQPEEEPNPVVETSITIPSPLAAWTVADKNGWHNPQATFGENIALLHGEVSEALDGYRKNIMLRAEGEGSVEEELADVLLLVAHISHMYNLDIESAVWEKHHVNMLRSYRHGGKKI